MKKSGVGMAASLPLICNTNLLEEFGEGVWGKSDAINQIPIEIKFQFDVQTN